MGLPGERAGPDGDPMGKEEERGALRQHVLEELEDWVEPLMRWLGLAWLGILVLELLGKSGPLLSGAGYLLWGVFVVEFTVRLGLSENRWSYVRRNWLGVLSLLLPALRVLRFAKVLRLASRGVPGLRLLRLVGSLNRGARSLKVVLGRQGFGYVLGLTIAVCSAGAAGMLAFEREAPGGGGLEDYPTALWWTAMVITTMGSDYFPKTAEGRALCFLLALYGFAVFGYVTATLATFFLGRDASPKKARAESRAEEPLRRELAALRRELAALRRELSGARRAPGSSGRRVA